jgi:hypothetical protein
MSATVPLLSLNVSRDRPCYRAGRFMVRDCGSEKGRRGYTERKVENL